jgi:hypothetical protein
MLEMLQLEAVTELEPFLNESECSSDKFLSDKLLSEDLERCWH